MTASNVNKIAIRGQVGNLHITYEPLLELLGLDQGLKHHLQSCYKPNLTTVPISVIEELVDMSKFKWVGSWFEHVIKTVKDTSTYVASTRDPAEVEVDLVPVNSKILDKNMVGVFIFLNRETGRYTCTESNQFDNDTNTYIDMYALQPASKNPFVRACFDIFRHYSDGPLIDLNLNNYDCSYEVKDITNILIKISEAYKFFNNWKSDSAYDTAITRRAEWLKKYSRLQLAVIPANRINYACEMDQNVICLIKEAHFINEIIYEFRSCSKIIIEHEKVMRKYVQSILI